MMDDLQRFAVLPIAVTGMIGGLLSGMPILCVGSFLYGALGGLLTVLWSRKRGMTWDSLALPAMAGLLSGVLAFPVSVVLLTAAGYFGGSYLETLHNTNTMAVAPANVEAPDIDETQPGAPTPTAPPRRARPGAPAGAVFAGMGLFYGLMAAVIHLVCSLLGGLLGGALLQPKDVIPPPPPPIIVSAPPVGPAPV